MNHHHPFFGSDLEELDDRLLSKATAVMPMIDVFRGAKDHRIIAMRHDVDDNPGSLDTAIELASWENDRGYRSTYYLLHGSHYWDDAQDAAVLLYGLGHEVGLHVNGVAEALRTGRDPHVIVAEALAELREYVPILGVVAHGDPLCRADGKVRFVNDEMFVECARPEFGEPSRNIENVELIPRSLSDHDLLYDANWISRGDYLSDSGGEWSQPFDRVATAFPDRGQLHILMHPDWWEHAFPLVHAETAA